LSVKPGDLVLIFSFHASSVYETRTVFYYGWESNCSAVHGIFIL